MHFWVKDFSGSSDVSNTAWSWEWDMTAVEFPVILVSLIAARKLTLKDRKWWEKQPKGRRTVLKWKQLRNWKIPEFLNLRNYSLKSAIK